MTDNEIPKEARVAARLIAERYEKDHRKGLWTMFESIEELVARAYAQKEAALLRLMKQCANLECQVADTGSALKLADELVRLQLARCDCDGIQSRCDRCDKARRYQTARKSLA